MLFLMANAPDVEKNLELIMSMLQVTAESIKNIKNGIDNFQASVLKMAQTSPGHSPTKAPPAAKPVPSSEPVITPDPAPTIQVPAADPPVS